MASCLGCCCAPCKPRYRRLVDAIYPEQPDQGLVKANMQKLTFYACSHPEKLDRIGDYLVSRLSRDLYRLRLGLVKVSVEAMDQLLQSCHGSLSLNLFVESFLKMVQKLLETNDAELEMLATESFVNFANIEEDTPSYHRRYDFFISKFSSMCHRKTTDRALSRRLRFAGLRGLRGVVWKTVSDDLQANIWEKQHMEKIVPSILYNMHDRDLDIGEGDEVDSCAMAAAAPSGEQPATDSGSPKALSDQCLRELMGKASFGSMRSVLQPVLRHCDLHNLWIPPAESAISSFRAIMYSIQTQYSYVVIQALIGHLDERGDADATTRIGIASVLSAIVPIAGTSIGPSLLEIFNSLLRHLRSSVEFQLSDACPSAEKEKLYQETLINAMGDFANSLPDYQKVEIMMFTIGKVPALNEESMKRSDAFLQHVLVKTLLKVATKYRTGYLATVLTSSFLGPLLKLALVDDAQVRLLTQQILHTLLDRHANLSRLQHVGCVSDAAELQLTVEKSSRADQMFMKKNVHAVLSTMYRSATSGGGVNSQANMDAILCTLSLLCVEVGFDEVLVELFRLVFGLQTAALDSNVKITVQNRARIHNLVAKYLNLSSQLLAIPALCQHVQQVIKSRCQRAHPSLNLSSGQPSDDGTGLETIEALQMDDDATLLFDKTAVADALRASGKDVTRLSMPFAAKATPDSLLVGTAAHTVTDGCSASLDMSVDSSPGMSRDVSRRNTVFTTGPRATFGGRGDDVFPLTVERLRDIVAQPMEIFEAAEQERTEQIVEAFRAKPFEELVEVTKEGQNELDNNVKTVLQRVQERRDACTYKKSKPKNLYELEMPEILRYNKFGCELVTSLRPIAFNPALPNMSSQVQQVRKQVEQLRREGAMQRVPVSQASHELKKFVEDHQSDDILVNGFINQKENPFKEKSSCVLL